MHRLPGRFAAILFLMCPLAAAAQPPEAVTGVPCPAAKPKVALASRPTPSERAYVAMATAEQRIAARDIPAPGRAAMDRALIASARAADGADLGLVLLSIDDPSGAIYAAAISAIRDPADALTANNLGAILKTAARYDSAFTALQHAHTRQPDSPVTLTNLGNVAVALGDGGAAESFYAAALKALPEHPPALAGMASLALCRGDRAAASRQFHKALSGMYLPAARAGFDDSRTVPDDGGAALPPPVPLIVDPIEHPLGRADARGLVLPNPPISGNALATSRSGDRLQALVGDAEREAAEAGERAAAAGLALAEQAMKMAAAGSAGSALVARNTYEKETFVLDDLGRIFGERVTRAMEPLGAIGEVTAEAEAKDVEIQEAGVKAMLACGDNDRCVEQAVYRTCLQRHANADRAHARFMGLWQPLWANASRELTEYYAFSAPWLRDLHDPAANQIYNAGRSGFVFGHAGALYATAAGEAEMLARFMADDCRTLEPPAWKPDTRPLKAWPDDPTRCKSGTLYISVPFVTLEGDCDAIKAELAAGIFASAKYKFGSESANGQLTLWGGVGVSGGAGAVGISGKLGPYVTYEFGGETPKMVDYGIKDALSVKANLGAGQGPSIGAGVEARLSAETGVSVDFTTAKGGVSIK